MKSVIQKSPETMTAKERVKRTFAFEKTDRVTIGYDTNAAIHHRLCEHLGIANDSFLELYQALGVDYVGISAAYTGEPVISGHSKPLPQSRKRGRDPLY